MKFSAVRIFRVSFRTVDRFYDRLCALAHHGGKGLHRLLNRYIDLDEFRAPTRRRKRSYLPEVVALETRMVPTIAVLIQGGYATAGQPYPPVPLMPPVDVVGTISDPAGFHGPYMATVNWGDGSSDPGAVEQNGAYSGAVIAQHIYPDAGTYTETVSVSGDADSGSASLSVTVSPPSPQVSDTAANTSQTKTAVDSRSSITGGPTPIPYLPASDVPQGFGVGFTLLGGTVTDKEPIGGVPASTCGCTDPGYGVTYDGGSLGKLTLEFLQGTAAGSIVPVSYVLALTWNGTTESSITYYTSGITAGDVMVMDIQPTAAVTASGAYPWSLSVTPAGGLASNYSGTAYVDISSASEGVSAGNGWTFTGVDRLISTTGGVIWKDGQGNGQFFSGSLGTFTSPAGDFGALTKNFDGSYTYVAKGGLYTINFNSSGYETSKVTADGQYTTFTYSGTELIGIATPDNRLVSYQYDGSGNLQSAQFPGGALATFSHDGSGNLTSVERPDGTFVTFAYDADGRITVKKTPDTTTSFGYDANGMLSSIDQGLGDVITIAAARSHGFAPNAVPAQDAVAVVTDALSRATTITLDSVGLPLKIVAPDGGVSQFLYDDNYDLLAAIDPLGRATLLTYDSHGDPLTMTTPDGAFASAAYDATLFLPTSVTDPRGNLQTFTYNGAGDLLTYTDQNNHTTTYAWSGGLLQSVKNPLNQLTSFVYDSYDDVIAVIAPSGLRTTYGYDSAGNQVSVQQPDTTIVTTTYDSMGRPTGIINPDGSRVTVAYDGDGNVVSQTDARGNLTTTQYDAVGRPVVTVDDLGNRTTTVYDDASEVVAIVDPYGNRTSFAYDADGRPVSVENQYGQFYTSAYDAAGQLVSTIDPYSNRVTYTYDLGGRVLAVQGPYANYITNSYDAAGDLISTVDQFGNRVTYVYDPAGQQIATEDQYGHFATTVYDAAGNVTAQIDIYGNHTSYVYDSYGRPSAVEDMYGHFTTTIYDSYGRPSAVVDIYGNAVTTSYDAYGRPQATVDALGNRTTVSYDAYGEPVSVQDSTGYVTTVYDSYGRVSATVDQLGDRTTVLYDSYGNVQATIDPLGNRTSYIYDSYGRPSAVEDARGHLFTTIYDSYGRVSATEDALSNFTTTIYDSSGRVSATENALAQFTTTIYDTYGRVSAVEDGLGNLTTLIYDSSGRLSAVEDARGNFTTTIYDSYGRPAATQDGLGNRTTTVYDSLGRVAASQNALGKFTTTIYDSYGRPAAYEDPLGNITTTVFDGYGREVGTIDPLGNRTTMVLDSLGREVNLIDADSNKTTFVYDALGREVEAISPSGGVTTMAYDGDSDLTSETSPNGTRIDYAFDADGNETGETWHNADLSTSYVTFVYDNDNQQTVASNSVGTYTLTYDAAGEVSVVKGLWSTVLTMTYDAAGNRTVVQDNFGGVTTNAYDADGNLTQQKFGGTGLTPARIDLGYDADNQLTGETRYSDLAGTTKVATTSIVYDAAGEETNQQDKTGGGTNIANYTWVYDNGGRLTSEQLNAGTPVTYTNDADGQLTGDGTSTQVYDSEGNRTGTGYSTASGNELQSDGTWDYSYDAAGNESYKVAISGGETWKYGYDTKNELVQAQLWTSDPRVYGTGNPLLKEVDYKYDAWGNLVERDDYPTGTGSPTVTRYAVDGWNPALGGQTGNANFEVWAELDAGNALQTRYLHGDEVDQLFGRQDAGVQYWYLTDRENSVRDVLDNSGNVKDVISYSGFGSITSETSSAYRGNYAWTGRQFDVETDLQYNRARWYDPDSGRWISQDPLGFDAGDSNVYRYATNNPLALTDASGLSGDPASGNIPAEGIKLDGGTLFFSADKGPSQVVLLVQDKKGVPSALPLPIEDRLLLDIEIEATQVKSTDGKTWVKFPGIPGEYTVTGLVYRRGVKTSGKFVQNNSKDQYVWVQYVDTVATSQDEGKKANKLSVLSGTVLDRVPGPSTRYADEYNLQSFDASNTIRDYPGIHGATILASDMVIKPDSGKLTLKLTKALAEVYDLARKEKRAEKNTFAVDSKFRTYLARIDANGKATPVGYVEWGYKYTFDETGMDLPNLYPPTWHPFDAKTDAYWCKIKKTKSPLSR